MAGYNRKSSEIGNNIASTTNLPTLPALNTKATMIENKTLGITDIVTRAALNTKAKYSWY